MFRKEAWPFYRTIFGVRLCWELEEPKIPKKITSKGLRSFLRKVEVFAVGRMQTMRDPNDWNGWAILISPVTRSSAPQVPKRSVGVVPRDW